MADFIALAVVLTSPALAVWLALRLKLIRTKTGTALTMMGASLAPALVVFVSTREADAITNAAGIVVAPMFAVYGLIVAGISMAVAKARQ